MLMRTLDEADGGTSATANTRDSLSSSTSSAVESRSSRCGDLGETFLSLAGVIFGGGLGFGCGVLSCAGGFRGCRGGASLKKHPRLAQGHARGECGRHGCRWEEMGRRGRKGESMAEESDVRCRRFNGWSSRDDFSGRSG